MQATCSQPVADVVGLSNVDLTVHDDQLEPLAGT